MSLEPRIIFNGTDEIAARRRRKAELAARVEEFGLFSKVKNLVTGKGFQDGDHPRGADGRFAKSGGSLGKAIEPIKGVAKSVQDKFDKKLAAWQADKEKFDAEQDALLKKNLFRLETQQSLLQSTIDLMSNGTPEYVRGNRAKILEKKSELDAVNKVIADAKANVPNYEDAHPQPVRPGAANRLQG